MVRPTAGAIIRNWPISSSNCSGSSDCAPSLRAWSGSGCTSIEQTVGARGHRGARHRQQPYRGVPCRATDRPTIGRCESFFTTGIAEISMVLRV